MRAVQEIFYRGSTAFGCTRTRTLDDQSAGAVRKINAILHAWGISVVSLAVTLQVCLRSVVSLVLTLQPCLQLYDYDSLIEYISTIV